MHGRNSKTKPNPIVMWFRTLGFHASIKFPKAFGGLAEMAKFSFSSARTLKMSPSFLQRRKKKAEAFFPRKFREQLPEEGRKEAGQQKQMYITQEK